MNEKKDEKPHLYDGLEKFEERVNNLEARAEQIQNNVNFENQKTNEKIDVNSHCLRKFNEELAGIQAS